MITPEEFVNMFQPDKNYKQPKDNQEKDEQQIKLAKVDPNYTSGRPSVIYDIDIISGTLSKPLPYLSSYVPTANDRVMVVKGVIVGKII
ncbi:hypothetical protein AADC60_24465 [Cytobacillus pseudoceanisediminis]|uniref:Uncharacterized protein n=1 Tax=Cytobacillus pseudoceanisediminis TaxID=3051614 RepID=A0ABZ2ZI67_9BACI